MQPKYTAEQYKQLVQQNAQNIKNAGGGAVRVVSAQRDFHEGEKGAWWYRTYDVDQLTSGSTNPQQMAQCSTLPSMVWVKAEAPTPPRAISPEVLSGMAYKAMKLPAAPVQLSPPADQIVNFPTYAKFSAALNRVWVTARFNDLGVDIAATTVATPVALRIDAGTPYADPRTCTYSLTQTPSDYQADTSHATCNITYRRSSGQSTYPLQAQITWKIAWNATANPDAPPQQPPLPDGMSTYTENVTVKEIQTVVR
jgi:enoyl reductase